MISPYNETLMTEDITKPDPAVVLDLRVAFRRSKTMFAAVALGVFDALAGGPKALLALAVEGRVVLRGLLRAPFLALFALLALDVLISP